VNFGFSGFSVEEYSPRRTQLGEAANKRDSPLSGRGDCPPSVGLHVGEILNEYYWNGQLPRFIHSLASKALPVTPTDSSEARYKKIGMISSGAGIVSGSSSG
jgi:hypothetical protein